MSEAHNQRKPGTGFRLSDRAGAFWLIALVILAFLVRWRVGYYQIPYFDGCGYIMQAWSMLD